MYTTVQIFSPLHLMALTICGSSSSLPSALMQLDNANCSVVKKTSKGLKANLAASLGGAALMELYCASAEIEGNNTKACFSGIFWSLQQTLRHTRGCFSGTRRGRESVSVYDSV